MKEKKFLEKKRKPIKFNVTKETKETKDANTNEEKIKETNININEEKMEEINTNEEKIKINIENDIKNEDYVEFDYCIKRLRDKISNLCNIKFSNLNSDYTFYCYNDLKELKNNKDFNEIMKKVKENNNNDELFQDLFEYFQKRDIIFENLSKEEFDTKMIPIKIKKEETRSSEKYSELPDEEQEEIFISALISSSFEKIKQSEEIFDTSINKNINKNYEIKIEAQNFNFQENSLFAFFNGIKFNNNITVINLSGNNLTYKSCFCLGNIFKYHKHLNTLSLMRCNLTNYCIKSLVLGATHTNEELNKKPIYIVHLNLKDNDKINGEDNNGEYSLSLLITKFNINKLNLANNKIGEKGLKKICMTISKLLNDNNKIFTLENLNLFNIGIQNQESLELLGDVISHDKSKIKVLILSKNNISIIPESEKNDKSSKNNYFLKFMEKVAISKNLKELLLLKCGIGKNKSDVDILCNMLEKNKSLVSLRMFDNSISNYDDFKKILKIFSEYKDNILKNKFLKSLDLSKNYCNIRIDDDFLNMIDYLNLENLDINQNPIDEKQKEIFRKRTNTLEKIKIVY